MAGDTGTSGRRAPASPDDRAAGFHPWLVACALCALAGVIAGGIAWRTHWQVKTRPDITPACKISEAVDCTKTADSPYAVFLRVPVALWGALGFGAILAMALWGLRTGPSSFPTGLLTVLSFGAFGVSAVMAVISNVVLRVLCIECTVIQGISLAVFVFVVLHLRRIRLGPIRAVRADLTGRPRTVVGLGLSAVLVAGLLAGLYPKHGGATRSAQSVPGLGGSIQPPAFAPAEAGIPSGVTDEGHPWMGAEAPAVVVVEYSDYECPFCRLAHWALREFVRKHPDRIRLVHVHLPLDQRCNPAMTAPFHRNACVLALAAVCAERQGRFWEFNDEVLSRMADNKPFSLEDLAADTKLDAEDLDRCLSDPTAMERLGRDLIKAVETSEKAGHGMGTPLFEIRDASRLLGRYVGFGGDGGIPEAVLRRLDAGWPEEP
jgi:uncharacterized membrane protein/protein-disulfide isomerase